MRIVTWMVRSMMVGLVSLILVGSWAPVWADSVTFDALGTEVKLKYNRGQGRLEIEIKNEMPSAISEFSVIAPGGLTAERFESETGGWAYSVRSNVTDVYPDGTIAPRREFEFELKFAGDNRRGVSARDFLVVPNPEPGTIIGLSTVLGVGLLYSWRRRQSHKR